MAVESILPKAQGAGEAYSGEPRVNDWSIQVATANGSGSQSANLVLLRTIFNMGVPVGGKNLFPSNIAGMPTWFTLRAHHKGFTGRKKEVDLLVAMNPETFETDMAAQAPGTVMLYNTDLKVPGQLRDDLILYGVPFTRLAGEVSPDVKLKKLLTNMVYVGALTHLLGLEMAEVDKAIRRQFKSKEKAANLNIEAVRKGLEYAQANLVKRDGLRIERMNQNGGKIIIEGNHAAALGAVFNGVTVVGWYPITPSTSLVEATMEYLQELRVEPDGKATYAVVQAEDELAAVGMVIGAGWAGARAMTATSGPGISLMSEFAGLAYYTEVPGVIFNVQRVGPSTGLPTRTAQGDLLSTAFLSHGDTKQVMLFPRDPKEAFDMAGSAFDLAERLQMLVFVMMDLDLGMNYWVSDAFVYPDKPLDRGKVLSKADLDRIGSFDRYLDVDGDGIPYRTLPGNEHPLAAYFTRGSGHNASARYSEKPEDYHYIMDRLTHKLETARDYVPEPESSDAGNKIAILAYGTSDLAMAECRDQLRQEFGIEADYLRVRAYPFSRSVHEFIARHDRVYVVDQNRDGQMRQLLTLDLPDDQHTKLRSALHYDGLPLDARSITDAIRAQEGK